MASISSTLINDSASGGQGIIIIGNDIANPDISEEIILSQEVPEGKTWRIRYVECNCRGYLKWKIKINDSQIGGGLTNPIRDKDRTEFPDFLDASSGQTVEVVYLYSYGPNSMPIDVFVGIVEV